MALGTKVNMPEDGSERRNCPPFVRTDSEYDVVDAEFTEVDSDSHATDNFESPEPSLTQRNSSERPKIKALWLAVPLLLIGAFGYRVFVRTDIGQEAQERPLPSGWIELSSCFVTRSFDGNKWLTLEDDQTAQLREALPSEQGKTKNERLSTGKWSYDETSKHYSVTLDGETTSYTFLSQDGVATCILVKGDLSNANLRESWFATADDESGNADD
jgi:hypothetical protein